MTPSEQPGQPEDPQQRAAGTGGMLGEPTKKATTSPAQAAPTKDSPSPAAGSTSTGSPTTGSADTPLAYPGPTGAGSTCAPAASPPADTGTAKIAAAAGDPGTVVGVDPFVGLSGELVDQLREALSGGADLPTARALVAAATVALSTIGEVSYQAQRKELCGLVGDLGQLSARCTAGQVVLTAEADRDGVVASSTCRSTTAWVRDADWHLTAGTASHIAKSARILRRPELALLAEAIRDAELPTVTAATIEAEFDKIVADLATDIDDLPEAVRDHILTDFNGDLHDTVLDKMIHHGAEYGPRAVTELRESFLAQYGTAGAFDEEQAAKKNYVELSGARKRAGVYEYRLTLDAEGHSVLEAAINTLTAPRPDTDTGEHDRRPAGQRRGQALIDLCRRAVAAGALPASPKTVVYLNADLTDLQDLAGAAIVIGTPAAGTVLSTETTRRMMCEACTVIPVVTDTDGTVIGVAEEIRLYNNKLTRALWRRDLHCTFPRCDAPATWCHVHHLIHYIDGGATTPENGALLCGRHHTIVHRDKLAGRIINGKVSWDLQAGSYTRMLATITGPAAEQAKARAKRRKKHRQRQADNGTSQT